MQIMAEIADFSDKEQWIVRTTLHERYGEAKELQLADSEIRLRPSDRELSNCPILYWEQDTCHFVIFKTGDGRYRCQFFYRVYQQLGTGVYEYDDITECVVSLLQGQADHDATERGEI